RSPIRPVFRFAIVSGVPSPAVLPEDRVRWPTCARSCTKGVKARSPDPLAAWKVTHLLQQSEREKPVIWPNPRSESSDKFVWLPKVALQLPDQRRGSPHHDRPAMRAHVA